jgi:hypothetical protein
MHGEHKKYVIYRLIVKRVSTAAVFQLQMLWALAWHEWEDGCASSTDRHERAALEFACSSEGQPI